VGGTTPSRDDPGPSERTIRHVSAPDPASRRPAPRHRRRPSQQVRLRRTIVGATTLVLLGVWGAKSLTDGQVVPAPTAAQRASTTGAPPSTASPTTPNPQDGSRTTETSTAATTTVPQKGNGKLTVVPVPARAPASSGRTVRYTVEIEGGLDVDPAEVARTVQSVLLDGRSWQKVDGVRFVPVSPVQEARGARVDIRVTLASPGLTDKLCAPMRTLSQVSCWNGERSVLNFRRWALGDDSYGKDVARYRVYLVNHEVGHGLGHQHEQCPGKGRRAPIMVQQTLSLGGCKPWPYPSGA
jgi:hypothetical protein